MRIYPPPGVTHFTLNGDNVSCWDGTGVEVPEDQAKLMIRQLGFTEAPHEASGKPVAGLPAMAPAGEAADPPPVAQPGPQAPPRALSDDISDAAAGEKPTHGGRGRR